MLLAPSRLSQPGGILNRPVCLIGSMSVRNPGKRRVGRVSLQKNRPGGRLSDR